MFLINHGFFCPSSLLQKLSYTIADIQAAEKRGGNIVSKYQQLSQARLGEPATPRGQIAAGRFMQDMGDISSATGLFLLPFSGGTSNALILAGEITSYTGSLLEYKGRIESQGLSNEVTNNLKNDVLIDIGIELFPEPLEQVIKKSDMDKGAKIIMDNQIQKVKKGTEFAIEQQNNDSKADKTQSKRVNDHNTDSKPSCNGDTCH